MKDQYTIIMMDEYSGKNLPLLKYTSDCFGFGYYDLDTKPKDSITNNVMRIK